MERVFIASEAHERIPYYEFQAVDRPLTPEEQRAVVALSSRTEPHPWRAVFTYSSGGVEL